MRPPLLLSEKALAAAAAAAAADDGFSGFPCIPLRSPPPLTELGRMLGSVDPGRLAEADGEVPLVTTMGDLALVLPPRRLVAVVRGPVGAMGGGPTPMGGGPTRPRGGPALIACGGIPMAPPPPSGGPRGIFRARPPEWSSISTLDVRNVTMAKVECPQRCTRHTARLGREWREKEKVAQREQAIKATSAMQQ